MGINSFLSKKYLSNYLIGFILFLAFLLRIWGLNYGLPYFFITDERSLIYVALKMAELKTLIPALHPEEFKILYYPPLMSYIYLIFLTPFILIKYLTGSFANFTELGNYFILDPTYIWLAARFLNVLLGVFTVYLIYLIGQKIFNRWVGIISALFLTFSFLHVQLSHFSRHWVPVLFFNCLIFLLSLYIYKSPQKKYYLWLGLVSGLAFGVSYVTSLSLIIFLIAHFLSNDSSFKKKIKDKNLWLALLIFLFLALIFILLYPQEFFRFTLSGSVLNTNLMMTKNLSGYLKSFIYYLKVLIFYEPLFSIFALLGIILFWFKSKKGLFLFLSWPIIYISLLYFFFYQIPPRYIVLIIPWLIILAARAIDILIMKFSEKTKKPFLVKIIFLTLVFIYPLIVTIKYDYLLSQKDTLILAKEWVERNIPTQSRIISNWSSINPISTKESILFQQEIDESSLRTADRIFLNFNDKEYPQPAYHIFKLAYISKEKLPQNLIQFVQDQKYQYFLVTFWNENELLPEIKSIIQKAQLIQEFKQDKLEKAENINDNFLQPVSILFSLKRLGPIVKIYKL